MEVYTEFELRLKFLQARNVWLEEQLANISRDDREWAGLSWL